MSKVAKLKAELALAEAEEAFIAAKAAHQAGELSDADYVEAKASIRALRQDFRENHRGPKVGAAPDPVTVKAG